MARFLADEALELFARGDAVVLVTLTGVRGSAPREAGARMLVWADGQSGTIGGGNLEFLLTREARALLAGDESVSEHDYPLGPVLGQCCGGRVSVRIERLDRGRIEALRRMEDTEAGAFTALFMFGAGHVGEAIARAAAPLPFRLSWFDTRPEYATQAALCEDPRRVVAEAPAGAFFLVLTHNHDLDYEIVRAVLSRGDAGYCGLIGSKSKRARFSRQLRADGLEGALRKLTCPIGGAIGLKGKAPAIIAASTVAELLLVRETLPVAERAHAE